MARSRWLTLMLRTLTVLLALACMLKTPVRGQFVRGQVPRTSRRPAAPVAGALTLPLKANSSRTSSSSSTASTTRQQMDALLSIKKVLDPSGKALISWQFTPRAAAGAYCNWTGVACDANRNVTGLVLPGRPLGGRLPTGAQLKPLTQLEGLILTSCGLKGTLPSDWSTLDSALTIAVGNNSLIGTLPASLGRLSQLQGLFAWGNRFTGTLPTEWSGMRSLNGLEVWNNSMSGTLPEAWSKLTSMQQLHIDFNGFIGTIPNSWGLGMQQLQGLDLRVCNLTGTLPASLGTLTQLALLRVNNNQLTGTLPSNWLRLTVLQQLWLNNNDLSGTLPPSWKAMTSLRSADLRFNPRLTGCMPTDTWQAAVNGSHSGGGAINGTKVSPRVCNARAEPAWVTDRNTTSGRRG